MSNEIKKDCFGYAKATKALEEHCSALNDFECKKGNCNFYYPAKDFDNKSMLASIKRYVETHNADGTRKCKITIDEIIEIIDN